MAVQEWLWHKLSDIFNHSDSLQQEEEPLGKGKLTASEFPSQGSPELLAIARLKAQGEWFAAIAALEALLLAQIDTSQTDRSNCQGVLLSGPAPVLRHSGLVSQFYTGIFLPEAFAPLALMPCQPTEVEPVPPLMCGAIAQFSLLSNDPLAGEQFCWLLTAGFGLLIVLGEDSQGLPALHFSFEPAIVQQAEAILRSRLSLTHPHQLPQLERLFEKFTAQDPDYRLVTSFSRQLIKYLPDLSTLKLRRPRPVQTTVQDNAHAISVGKKTAQPQPEPIGDSRTVREAIDLDAVSAEPLPDIQLLQALTHEIRTPLTTIRTMARLLLKRSDLSPDVVKPLEVIDQECTEQINRMELIFRAAELEATPHPQKTVQLVPIALEQVFQQSIPRWKKQAQRRNVCLEVVLPNKLPQVVSDPAMLDQMLTGLMEKFTRSLPTGGEIRVQVTTAGHQLKLQFHTQSAYQGNPLKALGQLLMFQPDTGSLSLNLDVTKNLFHALGGKLIVRQRPRQGEVLTIFLPLGSTQSKGRSEWL
jgi:signal transduction histidine kinase